MGPSLQGQGRSTGNHRLRRDRRIKRDLFFREIEELSIQFANIQVTECKVFLNSEFPMTITKGSGTQACIKYE